jgi:hypothetical protein
MLIVCLWQVGNLTQDSDKMTTNNLSFVIGKDSFTPEGQRRGISPANIAPPGLFYGLSHSFQGLKSLALRLFPSGAIKCPILKQNSG